VGVLQVQVSNPGTIPATLTGLVISAGGSGNDQAGIANVQVYLDANGNGVADGGESILGTGTYNGDNGTASITINSEVPANSNESLLVVYNLSTSAGIGTYQASINLGGMSGTSANGNVQFTGYPLMGAVITVAHATNTPTPTSTNTAVPTVTPTATATRSWTPMPTVTSTNTPMPTNTSIPTATWTDVPTSTPIPTSTPSFTSTVVLTPTYTQQPGITHPILYPNPSDGTQPVSIRIPGRNGTSDVKVQIFTVSFRLVQQEVFPQVPAGTDVPVTLTDKWGHPLASGLYYVTVTVDGKRTVCKLIILK
jgi:hypothetical protein